MSPVLVNPFRFAAGGPADVTEPWGEITRQTSIASGKLTISGLDLTGMMAIQLHISGITVTTDDSQAFLRLHIGGSEVSTGYEYAARETASGVNASLVSTSATEIPLSSAPTASVGNASTEGLSAVVTIFAPSGSLYKRLVYRSVWSQPDGTVRQLSSAVAHLENTGAITGVVVYAGSDLTGGSVIMLGVE